MFALKTNGHNIMSSICRTFLDEVTITMDTEAAFSLMILAQTFYLETKDALKDNNFLLNSIADHKLWSLSEFWEKGINSSIKEEIDKDMLQNNSETPDESKVRQDNIKFGKLGCFVVSMLALKINPKEVQALIDKVCKAQSLPMEMIKSLEVCLQYRTISAILKKAGRKCFPQLSFTLRRRIK
jgi:Myotubularin protein